MEIKSAIFIKGIVKQDSLLDSAIPQIALIGRSNVGKSSLINSLTSQKKLAKTSSFPGRTQEINLFKINDSFYLLDLPGYGFAKTSLSIRQNLKTLINWYLFKSDYQQKIIALIIDAKVGPTESDLQILRKLEEYKKNIIVVVNKIDKLKKSSANHQLKLIQQIIGGHQLFPCSTETKQGITEIKNILF